MNLLITAGNTLAPIDRVRGITNVFTGRTGAGIAVAARSRGHDVTLITSHPERVAAAEGSPPGQGGWEVRPYRTFDELHALMAGLIRGGRFDAVIHSAAVSDYLSAGVYGLAEGVRFDGARGTWAGAPAALIDRAAGKVKSDEPELWLRLVRAPKLVDLVRGAWGFSGVLVKFKLEVGLGDGELLAVAERSRAASGADLMVANTLDGAAECAYVGAGAGGYERVPRGELAGRLLDAVERHAGGTAGVRR